MYSTVIAIVNERSLTIKYNMVLFLVLAIVTGDMAEEVQRGTSELSSKLFVRNLWYGTTEEDLKEKFEGCSRVNIPTDPKSGSNKGYVCTQFRVACTLKHTIL